ncbi:3-phosphoshikimate 1-carboxyvinyltransferase [Capnocytophaga gingivalis]|uniref:3-phosphoshikimate 1-carboxyvinyltransferase n=1 Tax=Capnocytophaga gingivalis TaxID=1017 RepID=A0ABU5ZC17_9FLAO|nr:3-phosphoshikimate 1-carboxyvinyltransferase [Capnocytophaga gingivalis]MEB3075667.1 3-phosphoshikimate 1-carboxyvinyltransferase [Capnocytophaga gingivalis]
MDIRLKKKRFKNDNNLTLNIGGSKSETNRLLLLQSLYPNLQIENASPSKDSEAMYRGLHSGESTIDIGDAGTAMRFLTAYYAACQNRDVILTGSARMQERPIGILVEALRQLGAAIYYSKGEGFPPLHIQGKQLEGGTLSIKANVSSQYISALLLVAPSFANGLSLHLDGEITSFPYLRMTLSLLNELGIVGTFEDNTFTIEHTPAVAPQMIVVEPDWSSASYFYSMVALSPVGTSLYMNHYKERSLQGDRIVADIYQSFGVRTIFWGDKIQLIKERDLLSPIFSYNLMDCPDIAQTIAVTCFGLGIECFLSGLHTLNIKETNRLEALKNELTKLNAEVHISKEEIWVGSARKITRNISIDTYNDHRMAMAFAPLALKVPIIINDVEVVEKSFPDFWEQFESITENE